MDYLSLSHTDKDGRIKIGFFKKELKLIIREQSITNLLEAKNKIFSLFSFKHIF